VGRGEEGEGEQGAGSEPGIRDSEVEQQSNRAMRASVAESSNDYKKRVWAVKPADSMIPLLFNLLFTMPKSNEKSEMRRNENSVATFCVGKGMG
jgi:hypothetical protein